MNLEAMELALDKLRQNPYSFIECDDEFFRVLEKLVRVVRAVNGWIGKDIIEAMTELEKP